ncbi:MAG: hypothetical protein ACRC92_27025 [Peptostreptococcaceae bacterium]
MSHQFNKKQFISDLESMEILELQELVKALEEHFNVVAPPPFSFSEEKKIKVKHNNRLFSIKYNKNLRKR